MAENTIVNAGRYGNGTNNCWLPFQVNLQGDSMWMHINLPQDNPQPPVQLAVVDSTLLVLYANGMLGSFSVGDGKQLWSQQHAPHTQLHFVANRVVLLDQGNCFALVDMKNKVEKFYRLPFVSNGCLWCFQMMKNEVQYVYSRLPQQTSGPGDPVNGPIMSYMRYAAEDDNPFKCEIIRKGFLISVLTSVDNAHVYLVNDKIVYIVDTDANDDKKVKEVAFDEVYGAGLDTKGYLYVTGKRTEIKDKKELVSEGLFCFNKEGKISWNLPISDELSRIQPPAVQADGSIFFVAGKSLKKIINPEVAFSKTTTGWSFELPCESGKALFSILPDGSVLAAAGMGLLHINKNGKLMKQLFFSEQLVCRPVTDSNGNIFVGSATKLYCVR